MKPQFIVNREGKDFVLYAGLLDLAHEKGLKGITTTLIQIPSELNGMTAICAAIVDMPGGQYSGLGDASRGNVTRMMAPHIIRMAETRAKARALRDATNIGVTAFEELGGDDPAPAPVRAPGVATNGAARVDEDLGRGSAAPRPIRREGPAYDESGPPRAVQQTGAPATESQLTTIAKLSKAAGREAPDIEGLNRAQASQIISDLIQGMPARS